MKIRICILVIIIVFCCESQALSQQVDPDEEKYSRVYIGLNFGPGSSRIMNNPVSSLAALEIDRGSSLGGHVEIVYSFSKNLGLYSGLGFLKVSSDLSLNAYNESFNSIDSENDEYEYRIIALGLRENQKMNALNIPVCVILRLPIGSKAGLFLQPGLGIMIPLRSSYESTGTFTYKGYYPAYDILLENLPAYGFPSALQMSHEGELKNKTGVNIILSTGLDFSVSSKMIIAVGGTFYKTISDLSGYTATDQFRLSPGVDKINSFMSGTEKVSLESIGLSVSLRYRIN